jgi:hypothetical protein
MSGAPVLDSRGNLVAIHGKTDLRDGYKANLGIPVALFKDNIIEKKEFNFPVWEWVGKIFTGGFIIFLVVYFGKIIWEYLSSKLYSYTIKRIF